MTPSFVSIITIKITKLSEFTHSSNSSKQSNNFHSTTSFQLNPPQSHITQDSIPEEQIKMSSSQQSYQSFSTSGSGSGNANYSYTSTSSVSYTNASGTRTQHTYSDPSGTKVTTSNTPIGGEATYETKEYPAERSIGAGQGTERGMERRIEDVSDRPEEGEGERAEFEVDEPGERQ